MQTEHEFEAARDAYRDMQVMRDENADPVLQARVNEYWDRYGGSGIVTVPLFVEADEAETAGPWV